MVNNPRNEIEQNHKIFSLTPKGGRKRGKGGKRTDGSNKKQHD